MSSEQLAWVLGFILGWVIVSMGWETGQFAAANVVGLVVSLIGLFWYGLEGGEL